MIQRLKGKVAIVTGGAQGIGGATARRLAAEGAQVLIADTDAELALANVKCITDAGGSAAHMTGDVSKEETAEGMVSEAMSRFGRLDILAQNAFGISSDTFGGGAVEMQLQAWRDVMDLLTGALFLGAKYGVPAMEASGPSEGFDAGGLAEHGLHRGDPPPAGVGRIINMSSVHGLLQAAGILAYEAGKSAAIGMTRQMAIDYGPKGITVNAIAPGHILTEKIQKMWEEEGNEEGYRLFEIQYPVRRLGTLADIASAVAFLSTDEASFITGVCLPVDGGLSIQLQENIVMEVKDYIQQNPGIKSHFDSWGEGGQRK